MSYVNSATYLPQTAIPLEGQERFGLSTVAVAVLGIATSIPLQAIGRVYIGEVLIAVLALYAWLQLLSATPNYRRLAFGFQAAILLSLVGYIMSDLYRGVPVEDYVRGWSRWGILFTNFVFLCWLAFKSWKLFWTFVLGWQLGHALLPFIQGFQGFDVRFLWKFYYSFPVLVAFLFFFRKRNPKTLMLGLLGFGVLSVALDYRSVALVAWLTAAITFLSARRLHQGDWNLKKSTVIKAIVCLLIVAGTAVWAVQSLGARYGYSERFYRSNMKRFTFAKVTWEAICESPLIGYGSWAKNAELRKIRDRFIKKSKQDKVYRETHDKDLIIAHSQVLQGWIEGGIMGILFFAFYGFQLFRKCIYLIAQKPYAVFLPLAALFCINASWHLLFSPFKGTQRILIAVSAVTLCYLGQEIVATRQARLYQRSYTQLRQPVY